VLKPLDGMAGQSIFFIEHGDNNTNVSIETLTHNGTVHIMAQRYIPEIKTSGDKRIIMIDGKPIDYALARIPAGDDFRGNMARGARVEAVLLTQHEKNMCAVIGKTLREKGLSFVGLDVIGDYVTEINVTSPTGIQEIQKLTGVDPAEIFIDYLSEIV
jgi:glutathione synthase